MTSARVLLRSGLVVAVVEARETATGIVLLDAAGRRYPATDVVSYR